MKGSSIFKKLSACMVAGLTSIALLLLLGNSGTLPWFPAWLVFSLAGACLIAALLFPFIWHYKEGKQQINSLKIYEFLHTLIRYTIAFNLAGFGWKKIFGLQFVVPSFIAEKPMNEQSGEWLTWFYFGYLHGFGLVLALLQIVGAYLLLFRKTLLLAAIVLFAFMTNLTLINFFYHMNAGALTQSLLITAGLTYLILWEYERLKIFFLQTLPALPTLTIQHAGLKNLVRFSAILLSLLFTIYLKNLIK